MATFPVFGNNVVRSQYPGYSEIDQFYTLQSQLDSGITYTKSLNPGNRVRRFRVSFSQMSKEEMNLFEDFFKSVGGTVMPFSYTDDGGHEWPVCKFTSPELELQYNEQNGWGVSAEIRAIVGPTA